MRGKQGMTKKKMYATELLFIIQSI